MKRSLQLDFLRFCGVLLVMVNHLQIPGNSIIDEVLKNFKAGGWIGVDLFFVLSGYLVSGLIIKEYKRENSFNASRFLIRRGFKIYPTYYLFLIFSFLFGTYLIHSKQLPTYAGLFHESIFVSNYFSYNNGHLWSISVEEHFYFFLAFLFVILISKRMVNVKSFIYIYIILMLIGVSCRLYNYLHETDYDFARDYTRSHFRFEALFFGVLLAYLANYKESFIVYLTTNKAKVVFMVLAVLFLSTNFFFSRQDFRLISVVNLTLNPICFGYLMLNIINFHNSTFLKVIAPLAYIGKYSYSIYLFHRTFNGIAVHFFKHGGWPYYLAYFSMAFIGGIIVSKCVEYPLISIREKYFPSA